MDGDATGAPAARATATVVVLADAAAERAEFVVALRRAGMPATGALLADADAWLTPGIAPRVPSALAPCALVLCTPADDPAPALALLGRVRANPTSATLPVILIGADGPAGADDLLHRPVDPDELADRVRSRLRAAAAWGRALEEERRRRDAMTAILRRAPGGRTPEATAEVVCEELAALPGVAGAAIVAFRSPHQAITLAAAGDPVGGLCPGVHASVATSRRLHALAVGAPESHPAVAIARGALLACAPIRGGGVEALLLASGVIVDGDTEPALARLRAVTDDIAAVCDALLGPTLAGWEELAFQRSELLVALATRTFSPTFQPIVDLGSGAAVGYELLTRFDDGAEPQRRFAEAAAVGMGVALERATMTIGVAAAVTLPEGAFLSLNVSPSFLLERTGVAVAELARACDRRIVLEITEHDPIEDYAALLSAVADLGVEVQLSVDDAGAGYASLQHILALRPSFVKLDQSWIAGIDRDPARQALVAGLHHFADSTSCRLIAEGIETEAERATLHTLGVELGQGFLLGRPAPVPAAG